MVAIMNGQLKYKLNSLRISIFVYLSLNLVCVFDSVENQIQVFVDEVLLCGFTQYYPKAFI